MCLVDSVATWVESLAHSVGIWSEETFEFLFLWGESFRNRLRFMTQRVMADPGKIVRRRRDTDEEARRHTMDDESPCNVVPSGNSVNPFRSTMGDNPKGLSRSGSSAVVSLMGTVNSGASHGFKHLLSEEYLNQQRGENESSFSSSPQRANVDNNSQPQQKTNTTNKRYKNEFDGVQDIEDYPMQDRRPLMSPGSSGATSTMTGTTYNSETLGSDDNDDDCPGFFPTCGSGVDCKDCTPSNRHLLVTSSQANNNTKKSSW